ACASRCRSSPGAAGATSGTPGRASTSSPAGRRTLRDGHSPRARTGTTTASATTPGSSFASPSVSVCPPADGRFRMAVSNVGRGETCDGALARQGSAPPSRARLRAGAQAGDVRVLELRDLVHDHLDPERDADALLPGAEL